MSSSQGQEDVYETQNDQRLDELHSKIRTLRGVRFPRFLIMEMLLNKSSIVLKDR